MIPRQRSPDSVRPYILVAKCHAVTEWHFTTVLQPNCPQKWPQNAKLHQIGTLRPFPCALMIRARAHPLRRTFTSVRACA